MDVSVVIPMYNAQNTIEKCVESVLKQTYKGKMEIIIVNDGSKDDSRKIVDNIIKENSSAIDIKLINKENAGVSSARNTGLKVAEGDFIALLDSDDEWFSDKLQKQIDVLNKFRYFAFVGALIYKPAKNKEGTLSEIKLSQLISKNYFQPSTVVFKRQVLDEVGYFDESQNYLEDVNYFMQVLNKFRCCLLNEHLVLYDQGKKGFGVRGLSANLKEMEKGDLINLKFAYKQNYISFGRYVLAVVYSILRYLRRVLIVKLTNA